MFSTLKNGAKNLYGSTQRNLQPVFKGLNFTLKHQILCEKKLSILKIYYIIFLIFTLCFFIANFI
jgi:hypothetical protein